MTRSWINPLFYAFEALTVSQMAGQQYECVPKQLVPYGPGYEDAASRGCAIPGSRPGELNVGKDRNLLDTFVKLNSTMTLLAATSRG